MLRRDGRVFKKASFFRSLCFEHVAEPVSTNGFITIKMGFFRFLLSWLLEQQKSPKLKNLLGKQLEHPDCYRTPLLSVLEFRHFLLLLLTWVVVGVKAYSCSLWSSAFSVKVCQMRKKAKFVELSLAIPFSINQRLRTFTPTAETHKKQTPSSRDDQTWTKEQQQQKILQKLSNFRDNSQQANTNKPFKTFWRKNPIN